MRKLIGLVGIFFLALGFSIPSAHACGEMKKGKMGKHAKDAQVNLLMTPAYPAA